VKRLAINTFVGFLGFYPLAMNSRTAAPYVFIGILLMAALPLAAQTDLVLPTNAAPAIDTNLATPGAVAEETTNAPSMNTNAPPTLAAGADNTNGAPVASGLELSATPPKAPTSLGAAGWTIMGNLLTLGAVAGLVAYFCGLTRARHCGHTCTLLVAGVVFGLLGFWVGGFAMQSGGMGDPHAALPSPANPLAVSGLNHELGLPMGGHFWGVMGSAGFFLSSDADSRKAMGALFLGQVVLLALAVTIALGGALERARILALAIISFMVGTLIYPLLANWIWGGGWLAALGSEGGLGHGVVDLGGAGVIHLAAGTLALVLALELGPRYGRFGRQPAPIPGHNLPLAILGSLVILLGLTALNATAYAGPADTDSPAGLAATNTLLAAAAGLATSFVLVLYRGKRLDPLALCRGLLGGAVAVSAGAALVESWAAVLIGGIAGAIVQATVRLLDKRKIDDPVGAVAVHGAGGAWGLIALGLFANGATGGAINGVTGPVRGLLTAHDGRQLLAQIIGALVTFGSVFALGYACVSLTHKIVGIRVELADETAGLDEPKLGVLGYQADAELEKDE
jgi:ammonium transporter, Amt family